MISCHSICYHSTVYYSGGILRSGSRGMAKGIYGGLRERQCLDKIRGGGGLSISQLSYFDEVSFQKVLGSIYFLSIDIENGLAFRASQFHLSRSCLWRRANPSKGGSKNMSGRIVKARRVYLGKAILMYHAVNSVINKRGENLLLRCAVVYLLFS